jgi:hypothetical protein
MTDHPADEAVGALVRDLLARYRDTPEIVKIDARHRISRSVVLDVLEKTRVSVKDLELRFLQQGERMEFIQDFVI